jgi:hypothetical protein
MIYGYNSKLSSHGIDKIMDYGREFLGGIKKIRYTPEVRCREYILAFLMLTCVSASSERGRSFSSPTALEEL